MQNRLIRIGLIGKTNAGKSTLINKLIKEKISIENKKINTTKLSVAGVLNIKNTQIIFYDTPGFNLTKSKNSIHKKEKIEIWNIINKVDLIFFVVDVSKFNFENFKKDFKTLENIETKVIIIFNKCDLIKKKSILPHINSLKESFLIDDFFIISAKLDKDFSYIENYLIKNSYENNWEFLNNIITDKDDIFITNECTRNSLLKYLHQELPYNVSVINKKFKMINKNTINIKQFVQIKNKRYKKIILGKNGEMIKKIRETSEKEISNILKSKIYLHLEIVCLNAN